MNTAKEVDFKNLQDAHDYYYKEMSRTAKKIDTLCVSSAERLNHVRYKILRKYNILDQFDRLLLLKEKESLENTLRHFHGELDEEYIHGHNLGPDRYWQD